MVAGNLFRMVPGHAAYRIMEFEVGQKTLKMQGPAGLAMSRTSFSIANSHICFPGLFVIPPVHRVGCCQMPHLKPMQLSKSSARG